MGAHTTAHVKEKDRSLTLSHHESDAPLLPMAQIERLKEILPEKVDWVFDQAADEGRFRRTETKRVNTLVGIERIGSMLVGLIIGCFALTLSAYLAMREHDWVAGVIGGITVVGLVSAFVIGQRRSPPEGRAVLSNRK
ncbi:hypothetical protein [Trinickia dinghuensis]|uniref:DUF2335 domain-containing protein n=1 Tax=Trinickia dinghuensis TaxID=2291023 RepID=A0A3D8JRS4_9BURK|nr:hypothetical protein [Trinickia dinghuensis]RDU95718.1 hypothetical protein DWV00_27810 [Trinickia dinghuensis]